MSVFLYVVCAVGIIAFLLAIAFRAVTYDPQHEEIAERERNNPNIGKKFYLNSCSQPVPISVAEAYREANNGKKYNYEYTVTF